MGGNTLFLLFFSFAGENLRVLGLIRGRRRKDAAKMAREGAALYSILLLKYDLCIYMLHCIEKRKQSLGKRSELLSPVSQVNSNCLATTYSLGRFSKSGEIKEHGFELP